MKRLFFVYLAVLCLSATRSFGTTAFFQSLGRGETTFASNGDGLYYTVTGTWVGTMALQQSKDGVTWETVDTFTDNRSVSKRVEGIPEQGRLFRLGMTAFTSGQANGTMYRLIRPQGIPVSVYDRVDVSANLTLSEVNTLFGSGNFVGRGFIGILKDSSNDQNQDLVFSDGTSLFYVSGTVVSAP